MYLYKIVVFDQSSCINLDKMIVFGLNGRIWTTMVVFGQNLCISTNGCTCIWAKVVVFGQNDCIGTKWLYLGKNSCIWVKWLCLVKIGCIQAKWDIIFGHYGCIW